MLGFRSALTRVINKYAGDLNLLKKNKLSISGDDVKEGLTCVLSIKIPEDSTFESDKNIITGNVMGEYVDIIHEAEFYNLPYLVAENKLNNVLFVGSGAGNDVAAANRFNIQNISAVEIDPVMKNGRIVRQATIAFGITCLIIILVLDTPKALAAKIYSKFLTLRNSARTTPTNPVQLKRTTISVSNQKFMGKIAAKIIMTYKYGKDVQISINL